MRPFLPKAPTVGKEAAKAKQSATPPGAGESILVVDGNHDLRACKARASGLSACRR